MGFDLSTAMKEREDSLGAYEIGDLPNGAGSVWLSPIITADALELLQGADFHGFLMGQMEAADVATWKSIWFPRKKTADVPRLDWAVSNRLVGDFFAHCGLPNPFNDDGTLKDGVTELLGEVSASKG